MILIPLTTTNNEYDDTNLRLDSDAPTAARQACYMQVSTDIYSAYHNLPLQSCK
jgi:hypothetical protein